METSHDEDDKIITRHLFEISIAKENIELPKRKDTLRSIVEPYAPRIGFRLRIRHQKGDDEPEKTYSHQNLTCPTFLETTRRVTKRNASRVVTTITAMIVAFRLSSRTGQSSLARLCVAVKEL